MKKFKIAILLVLSLVLVNTYSSPVIAADDDTEKPTLINNIAMWADGIKFVSALTDSEGENMAQLVNKFFTGIVDVMLGYVCPMCVEGYDERVQNSSLPDVYKLGMLGVVDQQLVATFSNEPRVDVIAHLSEEWIPGYKESNSAYAANTGYQDLVASRVGDVWSKTRDIAYLGFVVIMIIIGFMIMFRNKIGGQVMVTVGNALPRVIISLILVTFSFAISGLIMDISGFLMRILIVIFDKNIQIHNIFDLLTKTLGLGGVITSIVGIVVGSIPGLNVVTWPAAAITLIVIGMILFGALKLWFSLIKSYFMIIINTVISPLAILVGAIPGNDMVPINVFKSILRNALVFPVAFAIVALPHYLGEMGVNLAFPESIVGEDTWSVIGIGAIVMIAMRVVALYVASQTPKFMLAIIPASSPKSGVDMGGAIKDAFGRVPLIGGMFRSKR